MADDDVEALADLIDGEEANYCGPGYGTCGSIAVAPQAARDLAAAIVAALPTLGWVRVEGEPETDEEWAVRSTHEEYVALSTGPGTDGGDEMSARRELAYLRGRPGDVWAHALVRRDVTTAALPNGGSLTMPGPWTEVTDG